MKYKRWWEKLKIWQKGAIFGGIIGLIFIVVALISDPPSYNRLLESLVFMFVFYILFPVLLGAFIGFLSSLTKNKFVFVGGIVGLLIGIFGIMLMEKVKFLGIIIAWPVVFLGKFISYIDSNFWRSLGPLVIFLNILLWILIGLIIGLIISKIKRKKKDEQKF